MEACQDALGIEIATLRILIPLTALLVTTASPAAVASFSDHYPEAEEIGHFQFAQLEGQEDLFLSGDFAQMKDRVSTRLLLHRKKKTLLVLLRASVVVGKKAGNRFEYQVRIPRGVDQIVFGRNKKLLWKREGSP